MLSRFIPCGANANYANFANYILKFAELVKFVKFALKTLHRGRCIYCLTLILLCCSLSVAAQADTVPESALPAQSMLMLDAGYASIHDSYLTPITYDGIDLGLSLEATRWASRYRWLWQLSVGADYNYVENNAKNNSLQKVMGDISFNMQHAWMGVLHPRLGFSAGPMAQVRAGIVYDAVNSNNPVTVRAHANLGATGMAWFNTHLGRLPITLRYQAQLPVVGVFFAPEYDESYYEIYLGTDLHVRKVTLRIGYRNRLEHWSVNNLNVHDFTHALVFGISL